jgi:hypothetical protein
MLRKLALIGTATVALATACAAEVVYPKVTIKFVAENAKDLADYGSRFQVRGHLQLRDGIVWLDGNSITKNSDGIYVPRYSVALNFELAPKDAQLTLRRCADGLLRGLCSGTVAGHMAWCQYQGQLTEGRYPCLAIEDQEDE